MLLPLSHEKGQVLPHTVRVDCRGEGAKRALRLWGFIVAKATSELDQCHSY